MRARGLPILRPLLREARRGLVLWSLALIAVSAIYIGFWPAMGNGAEMQALIDNMPEALVQALRYEAIGTPAGYLESTVYGLLAPVLLLVFAIGAGARLIAGQEEDGTLELEVTHPVSRQRVVAERLASLAISVFALVAATTAAVLVLVRAVDMELADANIIAASAGMLLLVLGYGTMAFGIGAATGRRGLALGVSAGLAVLAFIADAVAPLVEWGGLLEAISPFAWYLGPDPLATGWHVWSLLALGALSVVFAAVAFAGFGRRDLGV